MKEPDRVRWLMKQTWNNLLFLHMPVEKEQLRAQIPAPLALDTYQGTAWIGIVPFEMKGIRFPGIPALPYVSQLYELNVRTYVTYKGKPGVYFFSLDASKPLGVLIARQAFHLPYYNAKMQVQREGEKTHFRSVRTHRGTKADELDMTYWPLHKQCEGTSGSIEHWLTERYSLYTVKKGSVYRGDILHSRWPLQEAGYELRYETLSSPFVREDATVLAHYASEVETSIVAFHKVH